MFYSIRYILQQYDLKTFFFWKKKQCLTGSGTHEEVKKWEAFKKWRALFCPNCTHTHTHMRSIFSIKMIVDRWYHTCILLWFLRQLLTPTKSRLTAVTNQNWRWNRYANVKSDFIALGVFQKLSNVWNLEKRE